MGFISSYWFFSPQGCKRVGHDLATKQHWFFNNDVSSQTNIAQMLPLPPVTSWQLLIKNERRRVIDGRNCPPGLISLTLLPFLRQKSVTQVSRPRKDSHRIESACVLSCSVMSDSLQHYEPVAHQAPLSMGFSRQECWSRLPCPPPGNLPDPGIEPKSFVSSALTGRFFTTSTTWETRPRKRVTE